MIYDFDKVINRRNTDSAKWDSAAANGLPADVLPLWVADMDFPTAQPILDKLHSLADFGIFGYTAAGQEYSDAVTGWFTRRFGWTPESGWLVKTPGVVNAVAMAVRSLTAIGDAVLIQSPVYYPFYRAIEANGRRLADSPLVYENGSYFIDFNDFEKKIVDNDVKMFILCSPHNPIGRVWSKGELREIGRICREHDVIVVSDEIHCDFVLPGYTHTPFIKAVPDMTDRCVICTAPSKTFNLAGLQTSNIFIPNAELRKKFTDEIGACGAQGPNIMGLAACMTAYSECEDWLEQCCAYLRGNLDFFRSFLRERMPQLRLVEPEGTYFAWVDFSALGLSGKEIDDLVVNKAGLWLDSGHIFGKNGEQFQRFVLACPRETLKKALEQLERAVNSPEK